MPPVRFRLSGPKTQSRGLALANQNGSAGRWTVIWPSAGMPSSGIGCHGWCRTNAPDGAQVAGLNRCCLALSTERSVVDTYSW